MAGCFRVEFLAVNHSIPDALALCIDTTAKAGHPHRRLQDGPATLDGRITDLTAMGRLGSEGVDLLLVDSTNAEVSGFVKSESEILPALEQVMAQHPETGDRRQFRQSRPSHPAGDRCGHRARAQDRTVGRSAGPQHERGPRTGLPADPGGHAGQHRPCRRPARRPDRSCTGSQG